jgi:CRP-like cAMP-binding protein
MLKARAERRRDRCRLRALKLFARCSAAQLEAIAKLATEVDLREGLRLCQEQLTPPQLIIVLAGRIELHREGQCVTSVPPGGWFGHVALRNGQAAEDVTAVACVRTRVLVFARRDFASLLKIAPNIESSLDPPTTPTTATTRRRFSRSAVRWIRTPRIAQFAGPVHAAPVAKNADLPSPKA